MVIHAQHEVGKKVCFNLTFMVVEYGMFLGMILSESNISKAVGWIVVFVHPQRINANDSGAIRNNITEITHHLTSEQIGTQF